MKMAIFVGQTMCSFRDTPQFEIALYYKNALSLKEQNKESNEIDKNTRLHLKFLRKIHISIFPAGY